MQPTILCVEGKYSGTRTFAARLEKKEYKIAVVRTGKAAIASLEEIKPQVVVVNAPSMRTTGVRICQSLRNSLNGLPIILISEKSKAPSSDEVAANVVLSLPFTVRKLNNRIEPLLPIQSENCLEVGCIQLDVERNQVYCDGRKSSLTPKLTFLLKVLMQSAGEVLERNNLFSKVWETDFTEDTRTLDVHVSWLRKAIEKDPQNPKYLKTLRGVGYRLDV
ncbi:MAG: response regulator transcription factor [Chloroflexota bacterium]|nr:response regulator transcription factor [Chloroflexota bacterium]